MVHLTAKGLLLQSERVWLYEEKTGNEGIFRFRPNFKFAPFTDFVAYYIKDDGTVVTTYLQIQFNNDLPNYVSLYLIQAFYHKLT
jgi:hypothetical protein